MDFPTHALALSQLGYPRTGLWHCYFAMRNENINCFGSFPNYTNYYWFSKFLYIRKVQLKWKGVLLVTREESDGTADGLSMMRII